MWHNQNPLANILMAFWLEPTMWDQFPSYTYVFSQLCHYVHTNKAWLSENYSISLKKWFESFEFTFHIHLQCFNFQVQLVFYLIFENNKGVKGLWLGCYRKQPVVFGLITNKGYIVSVPMSWGYWYWSRSV